MPMTKNDIQMLLRRLADELAPTYGIKDRERFVDALASIIGYEDPSWDPAAAGDNGHSIGLFQLHDQGQGAGMSVAQRSDPETNIRKAISYLGPIWASSESQGLSFEQGVQRMITEGQQPADPALAYKRAMAAHAQVERELPATVSAAGTQQGGTTADFVQWLKDHGFGAYIWTDPQTGEEIPDQVPTTIVNAFLDETAGATGQTPLEEAETAQIWQEIGGYAGNVSLDEREQKRRELETEISAGDSTWQQAVDKFNAWLNSTQEARLRAEKEFDVAEKRAAFTRPTATYTRPAHKQVMEQYGLTYTPEQGIPTEQLPNLEETYSKWQQNLGVSQQAPAMAGVSAGPTEAQAHIQDLLRRAAARAGGQALPAMAGGGWVPRNQTFIAGELGPEIIQPTAAGTTVLPAATTRAMQAYRNWLALRRAA